MKKLILCLVLLMGTQTWAYETTTPLVPQQELKLLKLLQQMEPELVAELLSPAGVQWYIENTNNFGDDSTFDSLIQPAELDHPDMKDDKNAPKFN